MVYQSPSHKWSSVISSPLGWLGIVVRDHKLIGLNFLPDTHSLKPPQDAPTRHIIDELEHYFDNPKHSFSVPFLLAGTPFQQNVWRALQRIPSGQTLSYSALAKRLKTHARAIGQACRNNPIAIIIPCHRIVAMHDLGGFAGKRQGTMMDIKKWLLRHEQNVNASGSLTLS